MKKYILTGFLLLFVGLNQAFATPLNTYPSSITRKSYNNIQSFYVKLSTTTPTPTSGYFPHISISATASDGYYGPYFIGCNNSDCSYQLRAPTDQVGATYASSSMTFKLINAFADSAENALKEFTIPSAGITIDGITYDGRFSTTSQVCLYSNDGNFHTICANPTDTITFWGSRDMVFYFSKDSSQNFTVVNYFTKKAWSTTISEETLLEYMLGKYTPVQIYNQIQSWDLSYTLTENSNTSSFIDPYGYIKASVWGLNNGYTFSADSLFVDPDYNYGGNSNNNGLVYDTLDYRSCSSRMNAIIKYTNYYARCYIDDLDDYGYADAILNSSSSISSSDIETMRDNVQFCSSFAEYHNSLIEDGEGIIYTGEFSEAVGYVDYYNYKNPFKSISYSLFNRVRNYVYVNGYTELQYDFKSDYVCGGLPSSSSDANSETSTRYNRIKNMFEDDGTGSGTVGDSLFDSTIPVFGIVADKLKSPVVDSYNSGFSQIVPPTCVSSVSIPAVDYIVFGFAIIIVLSLFLFL